MIDEAVETTIITIVVTTEIIEITEIITGIIEIVIKEINGKFTRNTEANFLFSNVFELT